MENVCDKLYEFIVHSVTILVFGNTLQEANPIAHRVVDNALRSLGVANEVEARMRDVIRDTVESYKDYKDDEAVQQEVNKEVNDIYA